MNWLMNWGGMMNEKFLNRIFDPRTQTYSLEDGSFTVPIEMKYDMEMALYQYIQFKDGTYGGNGIFVLGTLWEWKKRLGIKS